MNGISEVTVRQINSNINLDFTRVIEKQIDVSAKLKEKEMVCDLLKTYAQQDVEIIKSLAHENERRFEMTANYIDNRADNYEKELQPRRLFGFARKADIRAEARQLAIMDGVELHSALSVSNNPLIQSIIGQRQAIKARLTQHFSNLLEYDNSADELELDKVLKMIPY